jgi:membrane protein required for colicin V production
MIIDIALLALLVIAAIKGLQRGIIVAVFSLIGLIAGIAAALKFSCFSCRLAPRFSEYFIEVAARYFFFISICCCCIADTINGQPDRSLCGTGTTGWVNKIGGALLYMVFYTLSLSVLLFFLVQLKLISEKTIAESVTYTYVEPWGPVVINGIGKIIPLFKDMFAGAGEFFWKTCAKNTPIKARLVIFALKQLF